MTDGVPETDPVHHDESLYMNPAFALIVPFAWIACVIGASIVMRRRKGKPIIPRLPEDAPFRERGCSGRSMKSVLTRFGGANNCLLVAITRDELIVTPSFPFNLMFLPEFYDLERRVARSAISHVEIRTWLLGKRVCVTFHGDVPAIELRVRDRDAFCRLLANGAR